MQLTFDADVEAFRAEFVAFLDKNLPPEAEALDRSWSSSDVPDWARRWQRLMFDKGQQKAAEWRGFTEIPAALFQSPQAQPQQMLDFRLPPQRTLAPYHSGILSCFFQICATCLFLSMRRLRAMRQRVECGRITSSI